MSANANDKLGFDDPDFGQADEIADLPRFAPPEPGVIPDAQPEPDNAKSLAIEQPQEAQQEATALDVTTNEAATVVLNDEGTTVPVSAEPVISPVVSTEEEKQTPEAKDGAELKADPAVEAKDSSAEEEVKSEVEQEKNPLKALEDQIKAVAALVLAERSPDALHPQARLNEDELARVAQHLNLQGGARPDPAAASLLQPIGATPAPAPAPNGAATVGLTAGQSLQVKGGAAVAEGVGALIGGALNLAGTAGKVVGQAAHNVADLIMGEKSEKQQADAMEAASGLPAVLPRLSEYRIAQVEKAASTYSQEADAFWDSSTKLTALRSEMERVARERGLSVQDVAEKMKPGGDFAELRKEFNDAVSENPDAGARKKAMDKALDSYVRQYGRAQEEILNPEQNGNPHYDRYTGRLKRAHEDIEQKSSGIPAFANSRGELEASHFEKLKEAVAKILEKLKEVAKEFVALFRGKTADDDHAPAP